ncbi:L-lactate dehydrogenase [Klebsiella pneumoniae IS33]|nr:L-lactate dehydrogenase [Klebsiella pneumoniae IS33]
MIISAASDYRAAAQRILPPFLFHYIDGAPTPNIPCAATSRTFPM